MNNKVIYRILILCMLFSCNEKHSQVKNICLDRALENTSTSPAFISIDLIDENKMVYPVVLDSDILHDIFRSQKRQLIEEYKTLIHEHIENAKPLFIHYQYFNRFKHGIVNMSLLSDTSKTKEDFLNTYYQANNQLKQLDDEVVKAVLYKGFKLWGILNIQDGYSGYIYHYTCNPNHKGPTWNFD